MLLELMINGKLKMTANVNIESLTHGQRRRKLLGLMNIPFDLATSTRFNFFNDGPKIFDVELSEDKVPQFWQEIDGGLK